MLLRCESLSRPCLSWVIRDRAEPGNKPGYVRHAAESGSKFIALMASPPGIAA